MDNELLERPQAESVNRLGTNASDTQPQYQELKIEPPQPPWHVTFEPPIDFDGQPYKELIFDFDSLTGKEFQRAERTFIRLYKPERDEVVIPETKHMFQAILAAQVADVPPGLIMKLPRRYYVAVRSKALKACGYLLDEDKA